MPQLQLFTPHISSLQGSIYKQKTQHRIEKSCGADYLFYKREHMNYVHVFLHIKSVASHASVYLMAAVIGTEAQQSFMPAPLRFYSVVYL